MSRQRNKQSRYKVKKIREEEMNSGVVKLLLQENLNLKQEVESLKKSLKNNQDELERLRSKNHELDKKNGILKYRLRVSFFPDLLKFVVSALGGGFAINFYFIQEYTMAIISMLVSIIVYSLTLYHYKKE